MSSPTRGFSVLRSNATLYSFQLLVVESVFTFRLFFEERFIFALYNLPLEIVPNVFDTYSRISQALLYVQQNTYEFVTGKLFLHSFLNLF